jgi:hypothetical protein
MIETDHRVLPWLEEGSHSKARDRLCNTIPQGQEKTSLVIRHEMMKQATCRSDEGDFWSLWLLPILLPPSQSLGEGCSLRSVLVTALYRSLVMSCGVQLGDDAHHRVSHSMLRTVSMTNMNVGKSSGLTSAEMAGTGYRALMQ